MSESQKGLLIIGAGGHAKVVLSTALAAGESVQGFLDDEPSFLHAVINHYSVVNTIDFLSADHVAVFGLGNNLTRKKISHSLLHFPRWKALIHPAAYVHPSTEIGEGTVVFAGAIIQPNVKIGKHCIINTGATIDHDCHIGDYSHLAPGVHLAGNVTVGEGSFLGVGSVSIPGISIGEWVTVGAGGVIVDHILAGKTVMGVPAKEHLNHVKNNQSA